VPESGLGRTPDVTAAATADAPQIPSAGNGKTLTLTVVVLPSRRIPVMPVLRPFVFRHNTVPTGKAPVSIPWRVTSKTVPSGQAVGIGVGVGVGVGVAVGVAVGDGVGVGVGVAVGVGPDTTVGVGVC
jgi:hypothetical protein